MPEAILGINVVGERVALGPLRRDLNPLYARWLNDFALFRTLANLPRPLTTEGQEGWYDRTATSSGTIRFTIYERSGWRPIGTTSWFAIDQRHRTAEFGILIGELDARGKGLGTEATQLMLDYAFTALGLHNVLLQVYEYNLAGQRTYEKAGFRPIGRRRQCHWMGGQRWDAIYMECLASEFVSPVLGAVFVPDTPRR